MIVLCGFVVGCQALARVRREASKGVLIRALIGVFLDGALMCLLCIGIVSEVRLDLQNAKARPSGAGESEPGAGLKTALASNTKM